MTVAVHINRLREKIEDTPLGPEAAANGVGRGLQIRGAGLTPGTKSPREENFGMRRPLAAHTNRSGAGCRAGLPGPMPGFGVR